MPHRHFQFSLRTLILVVFAYGLLWLLTLKLGGAALAQHYSEPYRADGSLTVEDQSAGFSVTPPDFHVVPAAIRGHAISPAPFVLLWKWEEKEHEWDDFAPRGEYALHFWWLGYTRWDKDAPTPQFQPKPCETPSGWR